MERVKRFMATVFNSRVLNMVVVLLLIMVLIQPAVEVKNSRVVITFGPPSAFAAGTTDYSLGTNGDTNAAQIQAALNALPNQGGLFHFKVGTYNITANASGAITRAIGNVTIEGEGRGTLFTGNSSFTAGGNQWVFRDLSLNATTMISMGATTGWAWSNVYDSATLWNSRTTGTATTNSTTVNTTQLTATTANITTLNVGNTANLSNLTSNITFDNYSNVISWAGGVLSPNTATIEYVVGRFQLQPSATSAVGSGKPQSALDADLYIQSTNNQSWPTGSLAAFNAWVGVEAGATGVFAEIPNIMTSASIGAGTVTNLKAVHIKDPIGAGTVTNNYGLYIDSLTKGTTLNWGIYNLGSTYLGGALTLASNLSYNSAIGNVYLNSGTFNELFIVGQHTAGRLILDASRTAANVGDGIVFRTLNGSNSITNRVTISSGSNTANLTLVNTNVVGFITALGSLPRFSDNGTGTNNVTIGTNNSPAINNSTPYTWIAVLAGDGATVYIPAWK